MPDVALNAFVDHGTAARTIDANLSEAKSIYDKVEELGIKWEETGLQLEHEGVASFKKSFTDLVQNLTGKADALAKSKPPDLQISVHVTMLNIHIWGVLHGPKF